MCRIGLMDINSIRNAKGQVWLNVASSTSVLEGFTNLDNSVFLALLPIYPKLSRVMPQRYKALFEKYRLAVDSAPMARYDCRKPIRLPDASVDHILCSHFLEHVKSSEARKILADFYRLLKPHGTLHIVVPDLRAAAVRYVQDRENPEAADKFQRDLILHFENKDSLKLRLLQFRGGFGLTHQWMYDALSMRQRLCTAGFDVVAPIDVPSAEFRKKDGSLHMLARKPPVR